ncbi:MAG: HlyD family efflux transporter periplasmic adaptor subunit [Magnetococcales bacterium]|nr:HlyD family efflux transporter periplasmic adaptor subunit [Magnetococcales bacterium]
MRSIPWVVTPAQNLLVIVPIGEKVEVEVMILNKDIGFVTPSLTAAVKVDAFPYTKYGTITGHVVTISSDSVANDTLGMVFPARIELERAFFRTREKDVSLTPGMTVTADITIGDRQLIEYLLAPLMQIQSNSFREN